VKTKLASGARAVGTPSMIDHSRSRIASRYSRLRPTPSCRAAAEGEAVPEVNWAKGREGPLLQSCPLEVIVRADISAFAALRDGRTKYAGESDHWAGVRADGLGFHFADVLAAFLFIIYCRVKRKLESRWWSCSMPRRKTRGRVSWFSRPPDWQVCG
jgi:hypothetical protein